MLDGVDLRVGATSRIGVAPAGRELDRTPSGWPRATSTPPRRWLDREIAL